MTEKLLSTKKNGMLFLLLTILWVVGSIALTVCGGIFVDKTDNPILLIAGILSLMVSWIPFCGLKVLKPQEALVLTLFGNYIGTLKGEGFYFVNPFCSAVNPAAATKLKQSGDVTTPTKMVAPGTNELAAVELPSKKMSLKLMTLNNARQKINDCLGNPIEIGIAVTWRIVDTAKAAFQVDNYKEFLSLQCDSALRNIVRIYPYDVAPNIDTTGDGHADEGSLRGSSEVVAARIRDEIQSKVTQAGLEIVEARITYLAYAPEIAAVMLQALLPATAESIFAQINTDRTDYTTADAFGALEAGKALIYCLKASPSIFDGRSLIHTSTADLPRKVMLPSGSTSTPGAFCNASAIVPVCTLGSSSTW